MTPFEHGRYCASLNYSIHYNPYRHKGSAIEFIDWCNGWSSFGEK